MRGIMLRRALYGVLVAGLAAGLAACSGGGGQALPNQSPGTVAQRQVQGGSPARVQEPAASAQTLAQLEAADYANSVILIASNYGIAPGNAATVNDRGFAALHTAMIASPGTIWHVIFSPGTYQYTNNRWLWSVQNIIIDAYGASFQCTTTTAYEVNEIPLYNGEMFDSAGNVPFGGEGQSYTDGYLINTANAGAPSVTTTTAANAGNFTAGEEVIVFGYDQQGVDSYPPNVRYFDYMTVASADASTGVITFTSDTSLKNFYDSRWEDTANIDSISGFNAGAPRILGLNRSDWSMANFIWVRGATFLGNPTYPHSNWIDLTGQTVILDYVTAPTFIVGEANQVYIQNSTFIGTVNQPDKLVDSLTISDTTMNASASSNIGMALTDCEGLNHLSLVRDVLNGSLSSCSPRNLSVVDTDINIATAEDVYAAISTTIGLVPVWSVSLGGVRVYNGNGLAYGFTNSVELAFTAGTGSGSGVIKLPYNQTDAYGIPVAYIVDYGMTLTDATSGTSGIVTSIYNSSGTLVIDGTWGTITSGDTINFYDTYKVDNQGGNVIVGTSTPFVRGPPGD
jgi:hypothetical protein